MKTIIIYTRVVRSAFEQTAPAEQYNPGFARFLRTYREFRPTQDHELVIVDCGGVGEPVFLSEDPAIEYRRIQYYGNGWDTGAYQFAANALDCDLLVCCNSWVHFHRPDWLYPLVGAAAHFGSGLYGVSASYERGPHIRTPCMAVTPQLLRDYPIVVNDREKCNQFEAGPESLTSYALKLKYPVFLMTATEAYRLEDWRRPDLENIFRRGTQENVLVWDRHTEFYAAASPEEKVRLAAYADRK